MAATRAVELGLDVLACASTGNLANSVAAHAARLGLECCVFIPDNLEAGKVLGSAIFGPTILAIAGNYDDVNRLCTQVADRLRLGVRQHQPARRTTPKARRRYGFEIVEQLGWRFPQHVVSPVAGGTLLPRIARGLPRASRRSASSTASCRASTRRRPPAARRSCTRSRAAPSIPSRCGPTRSPSRSRSATRPTATRCCRRSAGPAARAQP